VADVDDDKSFQFPFITASLTAQWPIAKLAENNEINYAKTHTTQPMNQ